VEALLNVAPTWSESTGGVTVERGSSLGYRVAILDALAGREGAKWLAGNRVVIDTANGAGTLHASRVLEALGAEVVAIGDGEGDRINEGCGALHPEAMVEAVRTHGAIAGIGLDGDGDRIAVCDATGRVLDGDAILWLCATDPTRDVGDVVVGTVMTNGGLEEALAARGIRMVRTPVGDTHVAEEMRRIGAKLGGEPSGHILFADGLPTADGLLAGLRALHPDPATLSERLAGLTLHPQVHAAVKVGRDRIPRCEAEIASLRQAGARVIVRGSGTEPVVRVMVEYPDLQVAAAGRDRLVALLEA
jgi:phosphoglucosamine mutase